MSEATKNIDAYLASLPEWQNSNLTQFRRLIRDAAPDIEEQWKWNTPVFAAQGKMIFAMSAFKAHTKYNFIKNGALLADKNKLFNNGLQSKSSRSIDLREDQQINFAKLRALIAEALALE